MRTSTAENPGDLDELDGSLGGIHIVWMWLNRWKRTVGGVFARGGMEASREVWQPKFGTSNLASVVCPLHSARVWRT